MKYFIVGRLGSYLQGCIEEALYGNETICEPSENNAFKGQIMFYSNISKMTMCNGRNKCY